MQSPEFAERLSAVASKKDQQSRTQCYQDLLSFIKNTQSSPNTAANLDAFLQAILHDTSLGFISSRSLLSAFVSTLRECGSSSRLVIEVGQNALSAIQQQQESVSSSESSSNTSPANASILTSAAIDVEDSLLREVMADAYEAVEEYTSAAKVLRAIRVDSSSRCSSDEDKARLWVRITRNYLEVGDTVSAEQMLNRIKNLPTLIQDETLRLHFRLSQARVLDASRRFLDASQEYINVSLSPAVVEEDRLHSLSAAVICATLAPAGPQRAQTLLRLYKDDRSSSLDKCIVDTLEKMYLNKLLAPEDVRAFSERLLPHQLAITSDGNTVLDRAVIDHNLLAASRLYADIHVDALARILGLSDDGTNTPLEDRLTAGEKAGDFAAKMSEQGRLIAQIDQVSGIIRFGSPDSATIGTTDSVGGFKSLKIWDDGVQRITEEIERVSRSIVEDFPVRTTVRIGPCY